jgi:hypothetical protein
MDSQLSSEPATPAQRFFLLEPSWATRYFWAYVDDSSDYAIGRKGYREMAGFKGLAVLDFREGAVAGDFVWNGALLLIVSKRVIDIFERYGITGYSTYSVTLRKDGKEVPGFLGLAVTGRGGKNDPKAFDGSVIPGTDLRRYKGMFPTQWDGSDLFTLDDFPCAALVTGRVRKAFKKEKVTNCRLLPSEEASFGY